MKQTPAESYRDKRHGFKDFGDEQRTFRLNERVQNVRQVYTETDIDTNMDLELLIGLFDRLNLWPTV
jgi:hypothetical protein